MRQGIELGRVVAIVSACLLSGCVTSPYDGQWVAGLYADVPVGGYADTANATVSVEVLNPSSGGWEVIGLTQSSPFGTLEGLYWFETEVRVADANEPSTDVRWAFLGEFTRKATLRVVNTANGRQLSGGNSNSSFCFADDPRKFTDTIAVAAECGYGLSEITLLVSDW